MLRNRRLSAGRRRSPQHRRALVVALEQRGFEVSADGVGPFVLVRYTRRPNLHAELRELGIAVRRADTFPGLGPAWVRIAVREPAATEPLLAALDLLAGRR